MGEASQVVKNWIKAIAKGEVGTTTEHLSPKLEWLENGKTHEESIARNPRDKWKGIKSKSFKYSVKEVCSDDKTCVMEFTAGTPGQQMKYCGVFKVSRGKITSARWYGDPAPAAPMVKSAKRA